MDQRYPQYPNQGGVGGADNNGAPESFGPAYGPVDPGATSQQPTQVNPAAPANHFAPAGAQGSYQSQVGYQQYQQQRYAQAQSQQQAQPNQPFGYQQTQARTGFQGYGYQQQAQNAQGPQLQREQPREEVRATVAPKQHVGLKAAACGLLGGVIGSAGIFWALSATGNLGKTTVVTQEGTTGQAISIAANSEDTTIAEAVAAKALPSVCSVYVTTAQGSGLGSGVVLDTDGNVLTNYHVAGDATELSVTIGDKTYPATLVGGDSSSDLAVVHAELGGDAVTPMEIGDSDSLVVGDWVMTIGSPFGLEQSVSAGVVSSLSRNQMMQSTYGTTLYANLIQTDATINPGNSGGALVNEKGQLVGVPTLFSSDTESFAGIGFAIPSNYAIDIANKIIAGEQVTHAYIGLSMQTVNAQNAAANKLSVDKGAYVAQVVEGSPADQAGIKEGDIVIKMGDTPITSADSAILAVRSHNIDETLKVTVMRGNEELTFDVTLSSDEKLQEMQQQLLEQQREQQQQYYQQQQQQFQQYDLNGNGNGYSDEEILQELYEYLYNNRGDNGFGR